MLEFMEDLLTLATLGELDVPTEPVDAGAVAREVVENLTSRISAVDISVIIGDLPSLRVPRTVLSQIFDNLIGNALRYAGSSGGPVEVGGERHGGTVYFHVRDHGPGIPAEEKGRIFEAFYRGSAVNMVSGTGIGLAIVQKNAHLYGGRAWAEETPGGGATIRVEIKDAYSDG
jgi:signal transduction histidine kinase